MKQEHALVAIMQGKFPTTKFNVSESGDVLTIKWIDGPRVEQVATIIEETDLPSELDEKQISPARGYSSTAIYRALQTLSGMTTSVIGAPVIRETSSKHGFFVADTTPIQIDGQEVALNVAVRGVLEAEDLTTNAIVSAVTVERWNGNLSLSMPKKNGEPLRFAFGVAKAKMILAALPDIQKYVQENSDEN